MSKPSCVAAEREIMRLQSLARLRASHVTSPAPHFLLLVLELGRVTCHVTDR